LTTAVVVLLFPLLVSASGPGVHVIESDKVLQTMVESDPEWAALAELPLVLIG